MSSAGLRHCEVPGLWQGEDKAAVGGNLCCPELPALTAPLRPAGFSDELQRQVRFVLLRPLQVGLSLSQVCPGGARLAGRAFPVVIWERGLPRAWATPGATPVTLQHPSLISPCKKETNVPCSGGAGWLAGRSLKGDLPSHPFTCSSGVLAARQAGRELPAASRSRSQCCPTGRLQGQASA